MLVAREVEKRNGWMSMFFHTSGVRAPTDFGGVIFMLKKGREMEKGVLSRPNDDVARIAVRGKGAIT